MEHQKLRRGHSRRSKSASALPIHPEVDSLHRRNGIRHFSHVISIRKNDPKPRNFSNFGKAKGRLVSAFAASMNREDIVRKNNTQHPTCEPVSNSKDLAQDAEDAATEECALNELPGVPQAEVLARMMPHSASHDQECTPFHQPIPPETPISVPLDYPYPQHIPPAAAPQVCRVPPVTPVRPLVVPPSEQPPISPATTIPLEKITLTAFEISIVIGALFAWIFRGEIVKYGGVMAILFVVWKLGQWNKQLVLRSQEPELIQQPRPSPRRRPVARGYQGPGIVPGGWVE
jgi:hypothetical protein